MSVQLGAERAQSPSCTYNVGCYRAEGVMKLDCGAVTRTTVTEGCELSVSVVVSMCTYFNCTYSIISFVSRCVCVPEVIVGELLQRVRFHSVVALWHNDLRNTNRLLSLVRGHGYQCLIGRITSDYVTIICGQQSKSMSDFFDIRKYNSVCTEVKL